MAASARKPFPDTERPDQKPNMKTWPPSREAAACLSGTCAKHAGNIFMQSCLTPGMLHAEHTF